MNKKIKVVLRVLGGVLVCVLGWSAYVASEGYFYFPPGDPMCDGEIGVVAIRNGTAEVFTVYTPLGGSGMYPMPMTNAGANRYVLTIRGEYQSQFDIERRPVWIVWSNIGESSPFGFEHGHRHIALPCIWPPYFITIRRVLAELAQPTVIKGATVTEFGIYTASVVRTVIDTNSVKGIREEFGPPTFLRSATNIPAMRGVMFGLRYRIEGSPRNRPFTVVKRWIHPPFKDLRSGELRTQEDTEMETGMGLQGPNAKWLHDDRLVVPGTWTFQLWYEGAKLCEQSFELVAVDKSRGSRPREMIPEPREGFTR